ncbi:SpoIIE family protein phosphatase [Chryseomicrobium sp. FSL W7-1435]|uniref:SpoIIE family protein phosphatase n=1 Tax=Chryseomicrobium sp. FSL W7-1435 TaxID=2921704 RepID=UPI00315A8A3C
MVVYIILTVTSSFIALMIAVQAWLYTRIGDSYNNIILAGIFLAIGLFDLFHLLTFPGMPASFFTTPEMSRDFWFIARVTELGMLLLLILQRRQPIQLQNFKGASILVTIFYIVSVVSLIFVLQAVLPEQVETRYYIRIGLFLLAVGHIGVVLWLKFGRKELKLTTFENSFILPIAIYYMFFYLVLLSGAPGHITYIGAHLMKMGALVYLFILLYIQFGEKPYREIERLSSTYERFLNTVGEGIFGVDPQGRLTFINDAASKMLGFRRDELVGRLIHPIIHHTRKNGKPYYMEDSPIYLSLETAEFSFVADDQFWRKDGTSFPIEYFVQPVFEQGINQGVLVTFKDITEPLKLKELERAHQAVQVEIGLAAKVQQDLFESMERTNLPLDMGVVSRAFKELNGDFYTVIPHGEEVIFSVADVSGKGLPAAIQMTMMQFAMEMRESPATMLAKINAFSYTYMEASRFITMFKGRYHQKTRTLCYASAGHEPGILYNRLTATFKELMPTGPILGIIEDATFRERHIQLEEGDILVLFTDGLTERKKNKTDDGEILRQALEEVDLSLPAASLAHSLFERINALEPLPVEDDQTLFVLKV